MAIIGELWNALEQINANNIRKWLYGSVLVRDWDPAGTTTLQNFTPFNSDGSLSTTLFSASNPGGPWFDLGAIEVNGVDFNSRYKTSETDIWQNRFPQRSDVDGDGEDIDVVAAETNGVALSLYNNLPLVNNPGTGAVSIVPSVGSTTAFQFQRSLWPQIIYRQIMVIGVDGQLSHPIYVAELRPRVSIIKQGKRNMNAKKEDNFPLTFTCYPDPASGYITNAIYGGPGFTALGGAPQLAVPDYVALAPPVLNTATIVPSTLTQVPSATGGTFAAGTYYWKMTALTAAGESIPGNEITTTFSGSTSSNALSWTQVTGATGYKIYRGTSAGGENVLVTTIGSGATVTYTDTSTSTGSATPPVSNGAAITAPVGLGVAGSATGGTLPAGTDYWVITAVNANGETTKSNEVNATLTGATSSAALTWTADSGATGYRIYRGPTPGGELYLAGYVNLGASTAFTDTGSSVNASALATHQAQLQWQQPTSPNQPFTYTITQTTGGSTTAVTLVSGPTTANSGLVTATVGSLTATNVYTFTVVVTAGDGQSATYPVSNSITST